jgi:hypothetical protein
MFIVENAAHRHRCFQIMTAFQRRNFEAWGTSLEIAFSKNLLEILFIF